MGLGPGRRHGDAPGVRDPRRGAAPGAARRRSATSTTARSTTTCSRPAAIPAGGHGPDRRRPPDRVVRDRRGRRHLVARPRDRAAPSPGWSPACSPRHRPRPSGPRPSSGTRTCCRSRPRSRSRSAGGPGRRGNARWWLAAGAAQAVVQQAHLLGVFAFPALAALWLARPSSGPGPSSVDHPVGPGRARADRAGLSPAPAPRAGLRVRPDARRARLPAGRRRLVGSRPRRCGSSSSRCGSSPGRWSACATDAPAVRRRRRHRDVRARRGGGSSRRARPGGDRHPVAGRLGRLGDAAPHAPRFVAGNRDAAPGRPLPRVRGSGRPRARGPWRARRSGGATSPGAASRWSASRHSSRGTWGRSRRPWRRTGAGPRPAMPPSGWRPRPATSRRRSWTCRRSSRSRRTRIRSGSLGVTPVDVPAAQPARRRSATTCSRSSSGSTAEARPRPRRSSAPASRRPVLVDRFSPAPGRTHLGVRPRRPRERANAGAPERRRSLCLRPGRGGTSGGRGSRSQRLGGLRVRRLGGRAGSIP